ncbi:MAG: FMN-binding negative transcriptional regulator [Azospirillum sp.]|nr:FMN-binding negative transcriptional regulator [Azospirillum sp.]
MYRPEAFREDRVVVLHEAIRQAPFATLVTLGPEGPEAGHLPLLLEPEPAPFGTLVGHLARANPQWSRAVPGGVGLAIFQGPNAYVSPSWYPTKRETGRVVPTWNYVAVQAQGPVAFFEDSAALIDLVDRLTRAHEADRPEPWAVADAPADYIRAMVRGIIGVRLTISRLEGSWKLSQNRQPADRVGVIEGLRREAGAAGQAVSALVAERSGGEREPKP